MADPEWKKLPVIKPVEQKTEPAWKALPVVEEPQAPGASMGESALQGYGQGASFGFADELAGASAQTGGGMFKSVASAMFKNPMGRALLRRMKGGEDASDEEINAAVDDAIAEARYLAQGTNPSADASPYAQARNQARREVAVAQKSNPKTFLAANIVGAASVPMPGGAAKPFQTVIGRSLENAGKLGVAGGLQGLGTSDAEDLGGMAADTALGAGIGGGMGFATGPAAYLWARQARPALQSLANSRAVSAIAPSAGLLNRLRKAGVRSEEDIQQLGSDILDSNILRPFGTAAAAKGRNDALMAFEGANIGATMDKADDLVAQGIAASPSRNIQRDVVTSALEKAADTPVSRAARPSVQAKLLENTGRDFIPEPGVLQDVVEPPATFRELWKNKSQLQSALKPDEFSNEAQKLYRKGVTGYTRGVYGQAESALGPDEVARLRESAKKYGTAAKIDDALTDATTRSAVNQPISLGDAARGAAFGDAFGGSAVATLLSSLMRGRTDSTLATGARALSRVRPQVPSYLLKGASETTRQGLSDDDERAIDAFLKSP